MTYDSLEAALRAADSPVEMLRTVDVVSYSWPNIPTEYTSWIEEQRAWRETCSLADQSHHMVDLWVEGPEAIDVFSTLGINDFDGFPTGRAKHFVACNPDGYVIGDGILFHLEEDVYRLVGGQIAPNWVTYHVETGDYDASTRWDDVSAAREGPPEDFRYQIQGPNAIDVMEAAADEPLPEIPFFTFEELSIDGRSFHALGHGMSGEAGFEFWGPREHAEAVKEAVLDAGAEYGIRQLGTRSYRSSGVLAGWVNRPVPAIYDHEELADYRRWLDGDSWEANFAVGGSFEGDDITEYYFRPGEIGYGRFISDDRDFVGREALGARGESGRTKVTLVWDDDDVVEAYASLFDSGEAAKFMDLPMLGWAAHYDEVLKDGQHVGVSMYPVYIYNERATLSLGVIDETYSEPGTEVTFRWGERGSSKSAVERHVETEIGATVARVPINRDRRKG